MTGSASRSRLQLERQILVVPMLVEGATIPRGIELPETLHPLIRRNAAEINNGRDFHIHVDEFIRSLDSLLTTSEAALQPSEVSRSGKTCS